MFRALDITISSYLPICIQLSNLDHFLQFPWKDVTILRVQWHAICLGLFASIIAPFGGFFASGFKRAFKIKVPHFSYVKPIAFVP